MIQQAISKAANWLAMTPATQRPHPVIPHLRKAYNLTPLEAVQAIREAEALKARSN